MFKKLFKRNRPSSSPSEKSDNNTPDNSQLTWHPQATQALDMAMKQAPVPALLKGRVRKELQSAAEATTRAAGRKEVTAEDLMNGLMNKLPPHLQKKAMAMAQKKAKK